MASFSLVLRYALVNDSNINSFSYCCVICVSSYSLISRDMTITFLGQILLLDDEIKYSIVMNIYHNGNFLNLYNNVHI